VSARTIYYCATSLDGYIATSDDDLDWLTKYQGSYDGPDAQPMEGSYDRFYDEIGALVMGSRTYEWVHDYQGGKDWPYAGKPTWVLTTRGELATFAGDDVDIRFAEGSVRDLYDEMAAAAGDRAIWVVGGGPLASQFAEAGLLDEVRLTLVPVVLGAGRPLFDRALPGGPLQLVSTHPFGTGMIEARYEIRR
jgi:dihydrofolate reductase